MQRILFFLLLIACDSEESIKVYNSNPVPLITSHSDGETFLEGYEISFQASISDDNHDANQLTVSWLSDTRTLCPAAPLEVDGSSICRISLEEGETQVRVQAADPEGASGVDSIGVNVTPTFAPTVEILSPMNGENYYSDQLIRFSATIQDNEDAPSDLTYVWESSIDGTLPADSLPNEDGVLEEYFTLTEGDHALSLTVTDLSGKSTSKNTTISVGGPNSSPDCIITSPQSGDSFILGETIIFTATTNDAELSSDALTISWLSDQDGELGTGLMNSQGEVTFSYSGLSSNTHTIQFSAEDEVGSSCSDIIVVSVGTPPVLSLSSPLDGDVYSVGDMISFAGTVSDSEEVASNLAIRWVSNLDGEFSTQGANSNGDLTLNTASLSSGLHSVVVTATDATGLTDTVTLSLLVNNPPTAPTVTITPNPANSGDTLLAYATGASDLDGQNISYEYEWYQNGILTTYTTASLPDSATAKGELWAVRVTPNDGYQDGSYTETSLVIQNAVPVIDSLDASVTSASTTESISCIGVSSDLDGDTLSEDYVWSNESTGTQIGSASSLTLSPLLVSPGQSVRCTYEVSDGTDAVTDDVVLTIGNSDPTISTLSVVPSSPYIGDSLNCLATIDEPDLETYTETYQWYNDTTGSLLGVGSTLTLSSSIASPNDEITCSLTVSDVSGGSAESSATATIGNQAPSIDNLTFSASSLAIGDTLSCIVDATDPEGDIPTLAYEWTNVTTGTVIGSSASISLTASMATGFDQVSCTVTASDSYGETDTESVTIMVDSTIPAFSTEAQITPSSAVTTSSTLNCSATASDPDGGSITYSYLWATSSSTNALGTSPSLTLSPATVAPTDVITCTVTATDTSGEQATSQASVMVENSAPTLGSLSISPTAIDTSTTVSCSVAVTEPDGETLTPSYEWTNGSTTIGSTASLTLTPSLVQPEDSLTCTASVTDGYGATASLSGSVVIANTAPVVDSVILSPDPAYNDSTLSCTVSSADADAQTLTTTYLWTNNTQGSSLGTSSSLTLDSATAQRGDEIECAIVVSDPSGGSDTSSASIVLDNRAPSAPTVALSPDPAYKDSTLTCTASGSSDPDADTVSYSYAWTVDGTSATETSATLSGVFVADSVVVCTVTPSDGLLDGTEGTASIVIDNHPPTVDSVTLSPDPLYTDNLLTATATTSDLDGDSLTLTYEWAINGTTVQSGSDPTFHNSLFRKEDLVTVTVTADDGVDGSVAVSASLTCQNSLPQAPVVSITPSEPVEGEDDLVCTVDVESSDADGDSIAYDFAWTVNGVPFTGATDASLSSTVSVADTEEGEEWICVVTPDDGDDSGASATSSATIESSFETSTFTNCGATGMYGPSQSDCDSEYASSALSGLITVSSGVQYWTVPASGTYTITAYGAQGGSIGGYTGGLGAMIVGDFSLTAGDVIEIVVGQVGLGAGQGSGGGGGTYVVHNGGSSDDDILVIAGGGGGANSYSGFNGLGGTTGTGGLSSNIPGHGGSGGNGGGGGCAGGGGGFFGDGDLGAHSADGGQSFLNGSVGGEARQTSGYEDDGGFGGGGAGSYSNGYGGGGGGYSGGGGGNWNGTAGYGGGAGSYNNGSNQSNSADNNSGHGSVVISKN